MKNLDPFALFGPPILALVVLVLGYVRCREIRGGRPLSSFQRKLLFYAPISCLGMGYSIMFQDELAVFFHWRDAWIAAMILWGAVTAAVAWLRHRKTIRTASRLRVE
jgi:hypothetical protein